MSDIWKKASEEAHLLRQKNQDAYETHNTEPTDGYRSRLEALWVAEFEACESLFCVECVKVPVWIDGPYGRFLSSYKPDLIIEHGQNRARIYVELKPNKELAMADDRQMRALELNPKYKFVTVGGYPYERKITVRMLTGKAEKVYTDCSKCQVLELLGCPCGG